MVGIHKKRVGQGPWFGRRHDEHSPKQGAGTGSTLRQGRPCYSGARGREHWRLCAVAPSLGLAAPRLRSARASFGSTAGLSFPLQAHRPILAAPLDKEQCVEGSAARTPPLFEAPPTAPAAAATPELPCWAARLSAAAARGDRGHFSHCAFFYHRRAASAGHVATMHEVSVRLQGDGPLPSHARRSPKDLP